MLWRRGFLVPWLLSAVVMFGLSYVWHGLALNDLQELQVPMGFYFTLAGLVYFIIGLGITLAVHQAILHQWIDLRKAFPFTSMLVGAIIGFVVYLIVYVFGVSFTISNDMMHIAVDAIWQIVEQAVGGLMVSLGIIYDMHRSFLESERVS
ncbi:MAG: hypothetical protein H6597_05825 [Flavobacteriales bacterium]|nr:hypothetical protein [Flavobacteriales bacterium]MCB9194034.1 hypothetical protein [Flavobacteriales bacterium]